VSGRPHRCPWKYEDAQQDSSDLEEYRKNSDAANKEERGGSDRLMTKWPKIECHGVSESASHRRRL
jgi:hypothetical protein